MLRRLIRRMPLWVIALLLAGAVAAAFIVPSNTVIRQQRTFVDLELAAEPELPWPNVAVFNVSGFDPEFTFYTHVTNPADNPSRVDVRVFIELTTECVDEVYVRQYAPGAGSIINLCTNSASSTVISIFPGQTKSWTWLMDYDAGGVWDFKIWAEGPVV